MTQEEKAKAYDDIIQRVTELYETGTTLTMEQMKHLFPELCESEDERIIEEIKFAVMQMPTERQDTKERCIAWLEKQKEQKHYWKPTETDVALFNKAVTTNKALTPTERAQLDIIRSKFGYCRAVNCSGIVQKEQKPAEIDFEDWDTLGYIRDIVRKHVRRDEEFNALDKWLTEHYVNQKPAEWSEEDEKFFTTALWHISYSVSNGKSTDCHCDTTDWLKSIKERIKSLRPSWKPSEEQMEELWNVISYIEKPDSNFLGVPALLESLYEHLKKL